jgi:hypothetical protein
MVYQRPHTHIDCYLPSKLSISNPQYIRLANLARSNNGIRELDWTKLGVPFIKRQNNTILAQEIELVATHEALVSNKYTFSEVDDVTLRECSEIAAMCTTTLVRKVGKFTRLHCSCEPTSYRPPS